MYIYIYNDYIYYIYTFYLNDFVMILHGIYVRSRRTKQKQRSFPESLDVLIQDKNHFMARPWLDVCFLGIQQHFGRVSGLWDGFKQIM
jgi:hypothetical protein